MAGVGEIETLYKDDKTIDEMAARAFDIDQVDHFRKTHMPLFFVDVVMFVGWHGAPTSGVGSASPAGARDVCPMYRPLTNYVIPPRNC